MNTNGLSKKLAGGLALVCLFVGFGVVLSQVETAHPRPVTLDVLSLMPESATFALGIPPVSGIEDRLLEFARGAVPQDTEIDARFSEAIDEIAAEAGVESAESLADVFLAKGVDPDAAIGLFVGPKLDEADDAEAETSRHGGRAFAVVFSITDEAVARASLEELLQESPDWDGNPPDEIAAPGVNLYTYGPGVCSFFISESRMALSNSLAFLDEIAARLDDPADLAYGTRDCPASDANEVAAILRMDHLAQAFESFLETVSEEAAAREIDETLRTTLENMKNAFGPDPAVVTLSWTDEAVEFLARLDMAEHDGLRKITGRAFRLRLAGLLPETSQGILSLRFNDESKELMAALLGVASEALAQAPIAGDSLEFLSQFMGIVDDELALAMTGSTGGQGIPNAMAMLAVTSHETLGNLVTAIPGAVLETHRAVEIKEVPIGDFIPLYYGVARNTVILATDIDELKGAADHLLDGTESEVFALFDPPVDPDVARYGGLFLKLDELAGQFAALGHDGARNDAAAAARTVTKGLPIRDLRVSAELEGTWLASRVTLHLAKSSAVTP